MTVTLHDTATACARIDLTGTWSLRSLGDRALSAPAQIPGDSHTALLAAGRIPDPFDGCNELDLQWLNQIDWEFSRSFEVDARALEAGAVYLVAEQIDTMSEIRINDVVVGTTESMFVRFCQDVQPQLRAGTNTITVRIRSAETAAVEAAKNQPYPIPHVNNPVQSPHRNLVRKVQCHGGWDWAPCLMVAGITDAIYLQPVTTGRIEYVMTDQQHRKDAVDLTVRAEIRAPQAAQTELRVQVGTEVATVPVRLQAGVNSVAAKLTVRNPKLWWPAGHGEQPLYDMTVSIDGDTLNRRLGLRTMEAVYENDDVGLSLKFRVNGRDIFCKGSNWIPCDALPGRQTEDVYRDLLESARAVHMNMIRVWGGGQYEKDVFYRLCDELGLMVWQDFMFSCALYPADRAFLARVRQEAEHQVKRLRDFACIALWCGNNENLGAMGWFKEARESRDRYLVDYDRLNEGVLGEVVHQFDPQRVFWSSSPCGGPGDYSDCFHDDSRGDMHYWAVWHQGKPFEAYYDVTPRFCSEFGYQAFPWLEVVKTYASEDQWNVTAPVMEHHQRNPGGNSKITEMFTRYFRIPEGFENFTYLSQVQQALAIKTGVEHWRHLQPVCMGTIIWQLNDTWPVASWSSIDYGGKWKLMHYAARRFYAPVLVSAFQNAENRLQIWLTSDRVETEAATVRLQVFDLAGKLVSEEVLQTATPSTGAVLLKETGVAELVKDPRSCFLRLVLERKGRPDFINEHFFAKPKQLDLQRAKVTTAVREEAGGFAVELQSDAPAFYVTLNAEGIRGEFDDNMISLVPNEKRVLRFTPREKTELDAFKAALSVRTLRDTYR